MSADPSQVELRLPNDKRLIAAIDAVVAHASERAGLSTQEQKELARLAAEACDETFSAAARSGSSNPVVHVTISDFPNRVEVAIEEFKEGSNERSKSTPVKMPDPVTAALEQMSLDRLHHEVHEGRPRTVLVKHHSGGQTSRRS